MDTESFSALRQELLSIAAAAAASLAGVDACRHWCVADTIQVPSIKQASVTDDYNISFFFRIICV